MRKIIIDLTSLLDVVLILLFVVLSNRAGGYTAALESAEAAKSEYEDMLVQKTSEYDELMASKAAEYDALMTSAKDEYDKLSESCRAEYDELIRNKQDEYDGLIAAENDKYNALMVSKKKYDSVVDSYEFINTRFGIISVAYEKSETSGDKIFTVVVNGDVGSASFHLMKTQNETKNTLTDFINTAMKSLEGGKYDIIYIGFEYKASEILNSDYELMRGVMSSFARDGVIYYEVEN